MGLIEFELDYLARFQYKRSLSLIAPHIMSHRQSKTFLTSVSTIRSFLPTTFLNLSLLTFDNLC